MEQSILVSTKKILGLSEEYTAFDFDIIVLINSAFATLSQLGVGPENGYSITDASDFWTDFLPNNNILNMAKTYIFLKVKLQFDPPSTSFVVSAMQEQLKEYEWRISTFRESSLT